MKEKGIGETKNGLVISDLHLFSARSEAEPIFHNQVAPKLTEIDLLVLNGDTFDFRWAGQPISDSIADAIEWLNNLMDQFPDLEIYFVVGNHDCHIEFLEALNQLPSISVHNHYLVLGNNLFVHGDASNYFMDQKRFNRFRKSWSRDQPKGRLSVRLYGFADRLKISALSHHLYFFGDIAVRRIERHLNAVTPGWQDAIDHCYFGHTHMPIENMTRHNVAFHNTGSAILDMGFLPQTFTYKQQF